MESPRPRTLPLTLTAGGISAVLYWFGTNLEPVAWLTWFAALPMLQLVSVTGTWGVTFLLLAVPAAITVATAPGATVRVRSWVGGTVAGLPAATLVFGFTRMDTQDGQLRVTAIGLSETGSVPTARVTTVYSRLGDWFAWLRVVLSAGSVVAAMRRKAPENRNSQKDNASELVTI